LYIPLVLFVIALVACFLALDYIRRGEAERTKGTADFSARQLRKMRRGHRSDFRQITIGASTVARSSPRPGSRFGERIVIKI
jgi:hypothetical protein